MRKTGWLRQLLVVCMALVFAVSGALADLTVSQQEVKTEFEDTRVTETEPVSEPVQNNEPAPVKTDTKKSGGTVVPLGVKEKDGKYILTINGQALNWDQDIASAVDFCRKNGIVMDTYSDGNGVSDPQDIVFGQTIPLQRDYAFYVDQGASSMEGRLHTVRMYITMDAGKADEAGRKAQEVYDSLQVYLGKPTGSLRVYTGGEFTDVSAGNITGAVKQMVKGVKDDYAFVSVPFNNLSLYIPYFDGKIEIYLNLSINSY